MRRRPLDRLPRRIDAAFGHSLSRQPVTLANQLIDLVLHPLEQRHGRGRIDACPLEVENVSLLALDLNAHARDLGPNMVKSHGVTLR